jgi:hypothetical protein
LAWLALAAAALAEPAVSGLPQETWTDEEVAEVCKAVLCRPVAPVRLSLPEGDVFEMTPPVPMPIVTGGVVTVLPGETVIVEGRVESDQIVDLEAVPQLEHPERSLVFHLRQEPRIGDGTGMLLKVESGFPGVVKYRLGMMRLDSARLLKTSSCPLRSGTPVFEHWPYPIFQLAASGFVRVDAESEAARVCE